MPTYMDRHDAASMTPEDAVATHAADLAIQEQYSVECFTYWFDEQRQSVFCLMEAPAPEVVQEMHRAAHGELANQIIEVDRAAVAAFLGRTSDPAPMRDSAFRAIMFTDMANSTEITNRLGDAAALELLHKHHDIIRQALGVHGGREVDRAGDGFLASFPSASDAVACAVSIQRNLRAFNDAEGAIPIRVRIGLGAGEPVDDGDSLFGSTINLTSRICDRAEAEQILVAPVVRDLCTGKPFSFVEYGEVELRGFTEPVHLHVVDWR